MPLVRGKMTDHTDDDRFSVDPELGSHLIASTRRLSASGIEAARYDRDLRPIDSVLLQLIADRAGHGDPAIRPAPFPLRQRIPFERKGDAPVGDQGRLISKAAG